MFLYTEKSYFFYYNLPLPIQSDAMFGFKTFWLNFFY